MLTIRYYKRKKLYKTKKSNDDIDLKVTATNNEYLVELLAKTNITLSDTLFQTDFKIENNDRYFLNGYQAWTDTHLITPEYKEKNVMRLPKGIVYGFGLSEYGDSHFYKYSNNKLHGYNLFYSRGKKESFIYNLNYINAYLVFEILKHEHKLNIISQTEGWNIKKGKSAIVLHLKKFNSYNEGLNEFYNDFKIEPKEKIFGYSSWYNYYQNINEKIILRDLDALDNRFNLFQIDDGYEEYVGDWMNVSKEKFPNGLKPIVDKIHEKGMKAGIWIAPFTGEEKSELFQLHKDWFKRNKRGKLVKCGGNWSGHYALDLRNIEALKYIKESLEYLLDLGFDFFKLDFIYASARDIYPGETRAQSQRKAYEFLRSILKDKIILGCGENLFSSYQVFDFLRVGPDVSLEFDDKWFMRALHRERISTKVTIKNTIFRSIFNNHLFQNDPDVFILRDENNNLSFEQRKALITIDALFGSVLMTSDDINTYDDAKKEVLNYAYHLFHNAKVIDYMPRKDAIDITYEVDGVKHQMTYDTERGVIINER